MAGWLIGLCFGPHAPLSRNARPRCVCPNGGDTHRRSSLCATRTADARRLRRFISWFKRITSLASLRRRDRYVGILSGGTVPSMKTTRRTPTLAKALT